MIHIRECTEGDLPSCSIVLREVYSEPPYNESWPGRRAIEYLETFLRKDPQGCFVATNDGSVIGAIFGYSYPWCTGTILFIQELFVSRAERRKGIGRELVTHALAAKGNDTTVALIVREGTDADDFYEGLGLSKSKRYGLRSGKVTVSRDNG